MWSDLHAVTHCGLTYSCEVTCMHALVMISSVISSDIFIIHIPWLRFWMWTDLHGLGMTWWAPVISSHGPQRPPGRLRTCSTDARTRCAPSWSQTCCKTKDIYTHVKMVLGNRTTPPEDNSPAGLPPDNSPAGRLPRRTFPPQDNSPGGRLPRRTTPPQDISPRRTTPPQDKCPVLSLLLLVLLPPGDRTSGGDVLRGESSSGGDVLRGDVLRGNPPPGESSVGSRPRGSCPDMVKMMDCPK